MGEAERHRQVRGAGEPEAGAGPRAGEARRARPDDVGRDLGSAKPGERPPVLGSPRRSATACAAANVSQIAPQRRKSSRASGSGSSCPSTRRVADGREQRAGSERQVEGDHVAVRQPQGILEIHRRDSLRSGRFLAALLDRIEPKRRTRGGGETTRREQDRDQDPPRRCPHSRSHARQRQRPPPAQGGRTARLSRPTSPSASTSSRVRRRTSPATSSTTSTRPRSRRRRSWRGARTPRPRPSSASRRRSASRATPSFSRRRSRSTAAARPASRPATARRCSTSTTPSSRPRSPPITRTSRRRSAT